ncbi:hypothetical protein D3C76_633900 [compost metagenome]
MTVVDQVEQREGVALDRLLGRFAAAAAVAAVMQQVDGMLGEGFGEGGQVLRHVLGIAAEVDQRLRSGVRAYRHQHAGIGARQRHQVFRPADGARLREVDQRALEGIQRDAQAQVRGEGQKDESGQGASHRRQLPWQVLGIGLLLGRCPAYVEQY